MYSASNNFNETELHQIAEVGNLLIQRNADLEHLVSEQKDFMEDQRQEINYLHGQLKQLRDLHQSRLIIYDNLEESIRDLESNNDELTLQNQGLRKIISDLKVENDSLQEQCGDFLGKFEQAAVELNLCKNYIDLPETSAPEASVEEETQQPQEVTSNSVIIIDDQLMEALTEELNCCKTASESYRNQVVELEEQRSALVKQALNLQSELEAQTQTTFQSFQGEVLNLEDVQQGKLCWKCLGGASESLDNDEMNQQPSLADSQSVSSGVSVDFQCTSDKGTQTKDGNNFLCVLRSGSDRIGLYDESTNVSSKFRCLEYTDLIRAVSNLVKTVAKNRNIQLQTEDVKSPSGLQQKQQTLEEMFGKRTKFCVNNGNVSSTSTVSSNCNVKKTTDSMQDSFRQLRNLEKYSDVVKYGSASKK